MSIIPAPPGGAAFVYTVLADVINASWDLAQEKTNAYAAKIANATSGWLDTVSAPHITAPTISVPTVAEPVVDIPASASVTDAMDLFDTKYLELVQLLSDKFVAFRSAYFPDESAAYTAADDWLQASIANYAGLPADVASQVWEEDRSRILADAQRASDEVLAQFSTKRFPLPPGAAASAVLQIQQKSQDAIAESSRKVAVMSIENLRFAVEKTLNLRQLAMGATIEYIKALASGPDMASRLINVGYDAQSKLIGAVSQFYSARTDAAKLNYTAVQHNADLAIEASKLNQASDLTLIEDRLKALLAEAQSLAQMATSLYNNLHAQASASGSDSVSSSA